MANIMVIDDELAVLFVTKKLFKRRGHETVLVDNGFDCLGLMRETRPDLVLLDIGMPGRDGWGVLQGMLGDIGLRGIPVLIFTAKPLTPELLQKEGAPMIVGYVPKPFLGTKLVEKVEATLDRLDGMRYAKSELLEGGAGEELAEEYEGLARAELLHEDILFCLKEGTAGMAAYLNGASDLGAQIEAEKEILKACRARKERIEGGSDNAQAQLELS